MTPMDLLKFNPCNLDHLTETYNIGFYLEYFTKWPQLCKVIEGPSGQIEAYSMSIHRLLRILQTCSLNKAKLMVFEKFSAKSNRRLILRQWSHTIQD